MPTIPQYPGLQHMQQCQVNLILCPNLSFQVITSECCMKNGLLVGDSNPRPLGHEYSALNTTPRRLAFLQLNIVEKQMM